jgi:hypothetical protein
MICIVLPVMELVPKGQETREECLFFPVGLGTDLPARRWLAALDLPVSPISVIGPALAGINPERSSPSAYLSDDMRSLCALQIHPAQRVRAHAALHRPPGYMGGILPPARR